MSGIQCGKFEASPSHSRPVSLLAGIRRSWMETGGLSSCTDSFAMLQLGNHWHLGRHDNRLFQGSSWF